ncbi:MAG: cobalt-zinc-cadmium resistance protein [Betaproteobacteria bacterium HGW-Betaproteobacteria-11]|nr:MAG: cobalt-zinc-cadmium resistance protein [Betaproteobacteria bacterium HGW-Betaproteobacteria-11]
MRRLAVFKAVTPALAVLCGLQSSVGTAVAQDTASHRQASRSALEPAVSAPLSTGFAGQATESTESATALTLRAAIGLALSSNADLMIAAREIEVIEGQVLQAQTRPNPELAYLLEDTQRATRTTTWQVNLPIEMGGKRSARIEAAQRRRDIVVAELATRQAELRASVTAAFFDVLSAQERVALAQDSVALARRATDAASKRVLAGKVSPVEETKARVAEAGVRVQLAQVQSELRNARQRLASLWADATPRFTRIDGQVDTLPAVPSVQEIEQRLADSPNLKRARMEIQRHKALVEVERAKQVPNVTVSVGTKRAEELGRNQIVLGVSVPLPFFDRNQGNLVEAMKREDKSRDELLALQVRLNTEVLQAWERLSAGRSEIDVLRQEVLPGAKSAYDAATIGFEFGKFNFLEVLDAQRTYFQAKSHYLKTLAEIHRAAADIDRLLGDQLTPMGHPDTPPITLQEQ